MKLDNQKIQAILEDANTQQAILEDVLYDVYKNVYILVHTNSFRGEGAVAHKQFLNDSTIHHVNMFMNVIAEVKTAIETIREIFSTFEPEFYGKVSSEDVLDARSHIRSQNSQISTLNTQLGSLETQAAEYISVVNTQSEHILEEGRNLISELGDVNSEFREADGEAKSTAESLVERIGEIMHGLNAIADNYYNPDGTIKVDKAQSVSNEEWYNTEPMTVLEKRMDEDPFHYYANKDAAIENQFARGYANDVYVTAGYDVLSYNYTSVLNDGTYNGELEGSVFNGNGRVQVTDHLAVQGEASVLYGNGNVMVDERGNFDVSGEVGVAGAEGEVEMANGLATARGSADVLTASGRLASDYQDMSNFTFGFQGEANLARAKAGYDFLDFKVNNDQGNEVSLFNFSGAAKAGIGADVKLMISSETVYDLGKINVNATSFDIGGKLGLGIDLGVTLPTFSLDLW